MRISDWSSDVCSSDLQRQRRQRRPVELEAGGEFGRKMLRVGEAATIARENDLATGPQRGQAGLGQPFQPAEHCRTAQHRLLHGNRIFDLPADIGKHGPAHSLPSSRSKATQKPSPPFFRSEERLVGKEGGRTWRSRWSPYPQKKKKKTK